MYETLGNPTFQRGWFRCIYRERELFSFDTIELEGIADEMERMGMVVQRYRKKCI